MSGGGVGDTTTLMVDEAIVEVPLTPFIPFLMVAAACGMDVSIGSGGGE